MNTNLPSLLLVVATVALPDAFAQTGAPGIPVPPPAPTAPAPPQPAPPPAPEEHEEVIERKVVQRRAGGATPVIEPMLAGEPFMRAIATSSGKPSRNLVVQFVDTDPGALARAEEDLAVMARILDKAARTRRDDDRMVLGINVDGAVFGSSSGARNIYVEGQGAIFLLSVKYPLLAPPEKPQEAKAKDTSSDEWKRAREEVTGGGGEGGGDLDYALPAGVGAAAEEFDEAKVNELKDALLGALKNAAHLRMVRPEETVTVVVQGADAGAGTITRTSRDGKGNVRVTATARVITGSGGGTGARRSESVLTLRVKKADADAFAAGKLDLDSFRKKVSTQTYRRRPLAAVVPETFALPVVR